MSKIIAYRYDTAKRADDQVVRQTIDHIARLTPTQREAELLVRAGAKDGASIRGSSVYSYLNRDYAEFAWSKRKGRNLYEVEIDEADVVHTADLDAFTAVETAYKKGHPTDMHVSRYWAGATDGRRVEVLASEVRVIRKIKDDLER
jgi:hypothetical protein